MECVVITMVFVEYIISFIVVIVCDYQFEFLFVLVLK
jgi:hypothetical protein